MQIRLTVIIDTFAFLYRTVLQKAVTHHSYDVYGIGLHPGNNSGSVFAAACWTRMDNQDFGTMKIFDMRRSITFI